MPCKFSPLSFGLSLREGIAKNAFSNTFAFRKQAHG